jgi:polyribonucleotide nucleotidyltransferase
VGDKLQVEIADIDQRGKISLVLVREDSSGTAPVAAATLEPVEADTDEE